MLFYFVLSLSELMEGDYIKLLKIIYLLREIVPRGQNYQIKKLCKMIYSISKLISKTEI